jgi:hypothetical protein
MANKLAGVSSDRLAEHFVNYLYDSYKGSRHVRRVASWIGFIIKGIESLGVSKQWWIPRNRQLRFDYHGASYVVKYDHTIGGHGGGLTILEVLPGRGSPLGKLIHSIKNLTDAEHFYKNAKTVVP